MREKSREAIERYRDAYVIHAAVDLYRSCYSKFSLKFKPSNDSHYDWITIELMSKLQQHLLGLFTTSEFEEFHDIYQEIIFILEKHGIMDESTYYSWGNTDLIRYTEDFYGLRWSNIDAIKFTDELSHFIPKYEELFSSPSLGITPLSIIKDGSIIDNITQGKLDAGVVKLSEVMHSKLVMQIESVVPLNSSYSFVFFPDGRFLFLPSDEANVLFDLSKLTYMDYFQTNMRNLVKTNSMWFNKIQYYIFRPLQFIRDSLPKISEIIKKVLKSGFEGNIRAYQIAHDQYIDNLQSSSLDNAAKLMYEQDELCFQDIFAQEGASSARYHNNREYFTYYIDNIHEQAPELFELLQFNALQRNTWYRLDRSKLDDWLFNGHSNVSKKINSHYYNQTAHIFSSFGVLETVRQSFLTMLSSVQKNDMTQEIDFAVGWLYGYYGSRISSWMIVPKDSEDMLEYPHESLIILTDRKLKFNGDRVTFKNMLTCISGLSSDIIPDNLSVKGSDTNLKSLASSFSMLSYISTGLFGSLAGGMPGGLLSLVAHGVSDAAIMIGSSSASFRDFEKISDYITSVGDYEGLPLIPYNASIAGDNLQEHPLPSIFTGTNVLTSSINYLRSVGKVVSCGLLGTTTWAMMAGALGTATNFTFRVRKFLKAKNASKFKLYDIHGNDFDPKTHGEMLQFISSGNFSMGDKLPDNIMRNFFTWKEFSTYTKANGLVRPILLPQFSLFGRIAASFATHAVSAPLKVVATLGKAMSNKLFEDDSEPTEEIRKNVKLIMNKLDKINDRIDRTTQGSGGEE